MMSSLSSTASRSSCPRNSLRHVFSGLFDSIIRLGIRRSAGCRGVSDESRHNGSAQNHLSML